MIYYGKGGFNFSDLYTMPVYLRNFYYMKLAHTRKLEHEAATNANKNQSIDPSKVARPNIPMKSRA